MPQKILKSGKVVIVLQGRYAGRKGVVVETYDHGTDKKKYGHALVVGVDRYPLAVSRAMGRRKIAKRSRVKPFVKAVNYKHLMPTRYSLDVKLNDVLGEDTIKVGAIEKGKRSAVRKAIKGRLEERYVAGKNKWFFTKLRF
eukprot:CAMPEP_0201512900 /NCGR_PEP_ID=MMETSP0161_2-20130828/5066_1 /ASSEMBLY_ACC=CAM_ASM_000251 /TAXON_ID=180227 /ORGANISM="Neoparamoeba aestuarina, Strain SoJaBio B1-5/56/2" /LENGTH=140 /DNA_ID=CAMNT_0047908915 /DNA_START=62 /DNA_END=484 /DNA_ORIENTATION=-